MKVFSDNLLHQITRAPSFRAYAGVHEWWADCLWKSSIWLSIPENGATGLVPSERSDLMNRIWSPGLQYQKTRLKVFACTSIVVRSCHEEERLLESVIRSRRSTCLKDGQCIRLNNAVLIHNLSSEKWTHPGRILNWRLHRLPLECQSRSLKQLGQGNGRYNSKSVCIGLKEWNWWLWAGEFLMHLLRMFQRLIEVYTAGTCDTDMYFAESISDETRLFYYYFSGRNIISLCRVFCGFQIPLCYADLFIYWYWSRQWLQIGMTDIVLRGQLVFSISLMKDTNFRILKTIDAMGGRFHLLI